MNTLLLHPTDTLFFRDGRPMSGSLAGHGAAWPLPTVINAALHAALHRADIEKVSGVKLHRHDHHRETATKDVRLFGSLLTAGPFPVSSTGEWFFPRPLDAGQAENDEKIRITDVTYQPLEKNFNCAESSLPKPLKYPAANTQSATKATPPTWWSAEAWKRYLSPTAAPPDTRPALAKTHFKSDSDFADTEATYGIGISAETGTQDGERFYSAKYLRLREGWQLGCLAEARDKIEDERTNTRDLITAVFPNSGTRTPVIIGGQQRLCTVERHSSQPLPLPIGPTITGTRVKWVLITPAIFPKIEKGTAKSGELINEHPGGWLPNWIAAEEQLLEGKVVQKGAILLLDGPGKEKAKRKRLTPGKPIQAKLVAAITGKPIPVTGYALPNSADPDRQDGGAKSTHLAVPAGAVYYFEAEGKDDAEKQANAQALAAALNWHGSDTANPTTIRNRRSTLMGEKGFGLGVCGTWDFHSGIRPA